MYVFSAEGAFSCQLAAARFWSDDGQALKSAIQRTGLPSIPHRLVPDESRFQR
jgi:hypothetical protein